MFNPVKSVEQSVEFFMKGLDWADAATESAVYHKTVMTEAVVLYMSVVVAAAINLAVWCPSAMAFVSLVIVGFLWRFALKQLAELYDSYYVCEDE